MQDYRRQHLYQLRSDTRMDETRQESINRDLQDGLIYPTYHTDSEDSMDGATAVPLSEFIRELQQADAQPQPQPLDQPQDAPVSSKNAPTHFMCKLDLDDIETMFDQMDKDEPLEDSHSIIEISDDEDEIITISDDDLDAEVADFINNNSDTIEELLQDSPEGMQSPIAQTYPYICPIKRQSYMYRYPINLFGAMLSPVTEPPVCPSPYYGPQPDTIQLTITDQEDIWPSSISRMQHLTLPPKKAYIKALNMLNYR